MVKVYCVGHDYAYEIKELLKLFFAAELIYITVAAGNEEISNDAYSIISRLMSDADEIYVDTRLSALGYEDASFESYKLTDADPLLQRKRCRQMIKRGIYRLLKNPHSQERLQEILSKNTSTPWGILTGIRPTKIAHELLEEGYKAHEIKEVLLKDYLMQEEKAELLLAVAQTEHKFIYPIKEDMISIYISIPFCPTRCVYCSFPSNTVKQWGHLMREYVEALCREIEATAAAVNEKGLAVETIYVGGGTPTTLSVSNFERLFGTLEKAFDISKVKEITVEAGRPDTIDLEKLRFLKKCGVSRLSINPQTMNDCTLSKIGRSHSVKDLKDAFSLARFAGFNNINMDIIIGLPGEDEQMVTCTMEEIRGLAPENLTVHTLAIKNASQLKEKSSEYSLKEEEAIIKMLEITQAYARAMELKPYYMYRQKHMLGHLENIGYCRSGYECIYNIQIMEEKQTILAFGAGAISKLVYPTENRLERVPNVKNLEQYLARVEEMVQRKKSLLLKD